MTRKRVVIAPDSFKGTVTAARASDAIAAGWRAVRPEDELLLRPMADGGEGTLDAFATAMPGSRRMPVTVHGPDIGLVAAEWLALPDGGALVELAATSGITLLDRMAPLTAHTCGFGEAIVDALAHGSDGLLLALGGSASTDGGAGALMAMGARVVDSSGEPVPQGNIGLATVARVDLSTAVGVPRRGALILGDVSNPLLGPSGAAAVFGPQKGADRTTVVVMEANLARFAALVPLSPDTPGSGAAGGAAFGLLAWGATIASGSASVGARIRLPDAIRTADAVITGEGRFDAQSSAGKVPSYVLSLAKESGSRALLVAGVIDSETSDFRTAVSLAELAGSGEAARAQALHWLRLAGARLAATI